MTSLLRMSFLLHLASLGIALACFATAATAQIPEGSGKAETEKLCQSCHDLAKSVSLGQDRDGWGTTMTKMIVLGLKGTNAELQAILDYLVQKFPAQELPPVNLNKARAIQLESRLSLKRSEAAAILRYRKMNGDFRSIEDLKEVPGLDFAKIEVKKDRLTFSQATPPASPQGGGRRRSMPDPISDDTTGFQSIFDGKTLNGWDGDADFWRAENGSIIGETRADKPLESNTFLIWRGGEPGDFELKLEYRINSTNSGIQYRSVELPDVGKWVLKGYQADIDAENRWTGQIYEERGRGFLALRGQFTHIADGEKPRVQGSLGDRETLEEHISVDGWNRFHLIARGNVLIQIMNDQTMSMVIDDDVKTRAMKGLLGIQLHVGAPMKVEVRNLRLKDLKR